MIDSFKICAIGILATIVCVFIKQYKGEFIIPTRIASFIAITSIALALFIPVIDYLKNIIGGSISNEYIEIMIKAISISYITQISSNICKDCGENNIALGIETVGKIEMIIISFPLIDTVLKIANNLISW